MKAIRSTSFAVRLASIVAVVLSAILALIVVIWTVANTSASAAEEKEVAVLLTELSPADPQTHRASAILHEKAFGAGDFEIALAEYEKAAAASPHNYLLWLLLGSARTRAGEFEKAESALLQARSLAPNYARVQWALGNLLLRQGREEEGYTAIQNAVSSDPALSFSAVTLAMQLSGGELPLVRKWFKGLKEAEIDLAVLLIRQERFDDARKVWSDVGETGDSERIKEAAKLLLQSAIAAKQFRLAAEVAASGIPNGSRSIGTINNPGFESPVRALNAGEFEWRVPQASFPQYAITDAQKRSGNFSLLVTANTNDAKDLHGIAQTVAVDPGRRYVLRIAYRSDINSKAVFFWEVRSSVDASQIAITPPITRAENWATTEIEFTVPEGTDGVEIRFGRGPCSGAACASTGSFWFDDLELIRN